MDSKNSETKKIVLSLIEKMVKYGSDGYYISEMQKHLRITTFDNLMKILYRCFKYTKASGIFDKDIGKGYLTYVKSQLPYKFRGIEYVFTEIVKYFSQNVFNNPLYPKVTLLYKLSRNDGIVIPYIKEYMKESKSIDVTGILDIHHIIEQYVGGLVLPDPYIVYYQTIRKLTNHLLDKYYNPKVCELEITDVKSVDTLIKQYVGQETSTAEYKDIDMLLTCRDYKQYRRYKEVDPFGTKLKYWIELLNRDDEYGFEKRYDQMTEYKEGVEERSFDKSMLNYIENLIFPKMDYFNPNYIAFIIKSFCETHHLRSDVIDKSFKSLPYKILQGIKRTLLNININDVPQSKQSTYRAFKEIVKDIKI